LKNYQYNDAVATSFYCYKDENGKLFFGPAWDFDWSFGGYNKEIFKSTTGDYVRNKTIYRHNGKNTDINLIGTLYNNSTEFQDLVCKVWKEKFAPLLKVSIGETGAYSANVKSIDVYKSTVESSAAMNYKRFPTLNNTIWGSTPTGSTYSDAVKYFKNFVAGRYKYMDKVYGGNVSSTTLYFDNSNVNWSNVYAYVWNNADGSDATELTGTKVQIIFIVLHLETMQILSSKILMEHGISRHRIFQLVHLQRIAINQTIHIQTTR